MKNYSDIRRLSNRTEYLLDSVPHRLDGPAIEYNDGDQEWCINGKLHRIDGPALVWWINNAHPRIEWYLNGKRINCSSQEEFEIFLRFKEFW